MKQKLCMLTAILAIAMIAGFLGAPNSAVASTSQNQTWLPDSLHWTLRGMEYWYSGDGDTFDSLEDTTGIPYSSFADPATGCMNCHPKDATYPTDPTVACGDDRCHGVDAPTGPPNWGTVYEMQMTAGQGCLKCHGREYHMMDYDDTHGTPDVHRDGSGTDKDYCTACHVTREMHDIVDPYYSLKEPGAMDTTCDTCHSGGGPGTTPPSSYSHDTHTDSLHCTACHQRHVTSCYNCHVDTAYVSGPRQAYTKIREWLFLMNYDGKVHSANMQSFVGGDNDLVWGSGMSNHINEGYEDVALMFAPVHSHSIMKPGRDCADCHATDIVEEIYDYGDIALTWLNGSTLGHLTGVIPVVENTTYNLVAFDKPNDVTSGYTWTPLGTDPYLYGPDDQYEIADGSALTATQLARLNYAATGDFTEFEDGIHNTYRGMQYWYELVSGNKLKDIVGVDYDDFDHGYQGCKNCHGAGGTGELPWPMNCDTCHGVTNPTGPPWTSDPDEIEPTCLRCHARESVMKGYDDSVGTPDVHRAKGMSCMECHSSTEVHNIGLEYNSHKDIGAMDTKCTDCHTTGPGTPQPGDYAHSVHTATVDCSACHQRRVISCYNCHMDTAVDGPMRMARTQIRDWVFLMNYDGKVTAANMQSFVGGDNSVTGGPNEEWSTYDERALMFAPMYSHSTMKEGRTCTDCHNTATVADIRDDGEMDLTWLDGSAIGHPSGVIPVGAVTDYNLLWYDKDRTVTSSPTWWLLDSTPSLGELNLKICNGEGLTVAQMGKMDNSAFSAVGHSTHMNGAKGPKLASCTTCHLSATPVNGDAPLADSKSLANTGVCDACHSPYGLFNGVDSEDDSVGAKDNWFTGVYADNGALQAGKEKWCAGCHDSEPAYSNPAEPGEDGATILDNVDAEASYTGTWGISSWSPGYHGSNYHYHAAGSGSDTFTWTINTSGTYEVFARWTQDPSRANDATYTVYHDSGSLPVPKNQRINGGDWNSLGTFTFDGSGDKVELVQNASGIVVADAIMLAPPADGGEVDNPAGTAYGTWGTSSYCPGYRGTNYRYHAKAAGTEYFEWPITSSGTFEVWARWAACGDPDSSRASDATYTVIDDSGSTPVVIDQRYNGGEWVSLGTFDFDGTGDSVQLAQSNTGIVVADAIQLTAPSGEVVVDNPDGTAGGTWGTSTWCSKRIGSDYRYHTAGAGTDTFTWTANIPSAGTYQVLAYWCEDASRASDATYTITYNGSSTTVTRDQRSDGAWVSLGVYDFTAGPADVELVQSENGTVIADAIKWTPDMSAGGTYAPNVVGDDAQTYGFYATGHGAASNNTTNCLGCHDASKKHIDHSHRTYNAASDNYQAGYRLAQPMAVPRPTAPNPLAYLDDFALCGNCHNLYEVLGTSEADWSHTNFRDNGRNSHYYHMKGTAFGFDSDWDGVNDSTITCTACHNAHGAPNQAMIRHGELISTYGTADKVPALNFCYMAPGCDTDAALEDSSGSKIAPITSLSQFMCNSCHTGRTMTRAPYLGAKVLTTKADPDPATADNSTSIVLTALVMDHNDNVSSVTIDLTDVGGSSGTAMYDDGSTGGDLAVDGVYTVTTTFSDGEGVISLPVTATDSEGTGENDLVVTVINLLIVDNTDAGASATGTWGTSSWTPGYYGSNYHYHTAGSGTDIFTWTVPAGVGTGTEVFARWTQDPSRATLAEYKVYHDGIGSPTSVYKDQTSQGGQWVSLGTYDFSGGDDKVELVQNADGIVVADAIKVLP